MMVLRNDEEFRDQPFGTVNARLVAWKLQKAHTRGKAITQWRPHT
jgi:hypothetical protein